MYMHGGAADDASTLSDLWSFNITSLKWSHLLPAACIPDPSACSFAARSHVLAKFAPFLYAWDTLAGRFSRFSLTSSTWESLPLPSIPRFHHLSLAQVSSQVFLALGLTTDAASNILCVITFSPVGNPVKFAVVNASNAPLVVGGCMVAFGSQVLVLGGKSAAGAAAIDYRCCFLCCRIPAQLTLLFSCSGGGAYGFWIDADALSDGGVNATMGTPLCGPLPANIGSTCAVLNNSVVSVGGYDCASAQRMQVLLRSSARTHYHNPPSLTPPFLIGAPRSSQVEQRLSPSFTAAPSLHQLRPPSSQQLAAQQ